MAKYKLFKVGLDGCYDIIAAETAEQALAHQLSLIEPNHYSVGEVPEVSRLIQIRWRNSRRNGQI
ncbi:hypothetical protein [Bacillus velezensis]|uniref:hypothetical protein n=1 Tax=Bacillus velezensis TaxID=492670 RepID=UPI001E639FFE|nr:hypothetical protein [Bacillus velezensis]